MLRKTFLLVALMWCVSVVSGASPKKMNLGGKWQFAERGSDRWLEAVVPGTVQQDLIRHGLLPDPFYGMNEERVQWVEDRDWSYRRSFEITRRDLAHESARLHFEGLDTYAEVRLNGELILRSDNMFVGREVEVRPLLREGRNELQIEFRSPIREMMPRREADGFDYPADNDHRREKLSIYTRKAPYSYGWDWGIRMVTMGVWRPVWLEFGDVARIGDVYVQQKSLDDREAQLMCRVALQRIGRPSDLEVGVDCLLGGKRVAYCEEIVSCEEADREVELPMTIRDPKRWMPNGWGDQTLYEVKVEVRHKGRVVAEAERRIGLRTLRVVQECNNEGESFYFEVNGIPMFAKGANYIPQDALLPSVGEERYRRLFEDVREAGMNMIRVWGGGTYESDLFYDLADEYGILIWQDFMFACTTYPHDELFLKQVEDEARYNLIRLRNHPSLAMWCGNNEIAEGLKYWGWNRKYDAKIFEGMKRGYDTLFCKLLPDAVARWDEGRFYMHTSPMVANWGRPATWTVGDSHNWGVWYGQKPFESLDTDIPRFMSEFGFQAFPEMKTIATFAPEEAYALESEIMTAHQKSSIGNDLIRTYMERDYRVPEKFEDFVYVGLVMQGEGMRRGFESHRRHRPYCMGTLYWQLNDSWPVVSWSGIDYYGNWKALHYEARRAFRDLTFSVVEENGAFEVWLLSDRLTDAEDLSLKLELLDFEGRLLKQKEIRCKAEANKSQRILVENLADWALQPENSFLKMTLAENGREKVVDTHYFVKTKNLQLPEVEVACSQRVCNGECEVRVSSPVLVKNLFVECPIQGVRYSDNFFDLLPGEERVIRITSPEIKRGEKLNLKLNHIRATYK